jgi:hypothetical protein
MKAALKAIPQQEFPKCFQQWQHRWAKCTAAQGSILKMTPLVSCILAIKSFQELHCHTMSKEKGDESEIILGNYVWKKYNQILFSPCY